MRLRLYCQLFIGEAIVIRMLGKVTYGNKSLN